MPYLLQISIGPVQSFIMSARRTRDLKFSSSFLSALARVAAKTLASQCGDTSLIFPRRPDDLSTDVPNKILAYVQQDIHPETLAESIKNEIDKKVGEIRDKVFERIGQGRFDDVGAERQIADLVEYIWVAVPYDEDNDTYSTARTWLEALLATRKNTRDFAPVSWNSSQLKSSIDGQLESVIFEEEYPRVRNLKAVSNAEKLQISNQINALRKYFDAGPHEKLSGVDLLKRLGAIEDGEGSFPSTSHMAALPFLAGLQALSVSAQLDSSSRINDYIAALLALEGTVPGFKLDVLPKAYQNSSFNGQILTLKKYDGALLYPERFPDIVGDAQIFKDAQKQFQQATNILDDFLREIGIRPTPYYALLVADGDSMGKVIDAQAQGEGGPLRHQELSDRLTDFAESVREIIEKHAGVRIYSGGDDVVALLPLHSAAQCAYNLAQSFSHTLQEFIYDGDRRPTLSAGLAIVHHLHPLGDALRIARDAEKRAKRGDKDSLAITVQKRGGPPCHVGGQWEQFMQRLNYQITLCRQEIIPSGMAYELEELALRLEPPQRDKEQEQEPKPEKPRPREDQEPKLSSPHVRYAALRIFQRKLSEAGREKDKKAAALALYALKRMVGLIEVGSEAESPEQAFEILRKAWNIKDEETQRLNELREKASVCDKFQPVRIEALADELLVARFFADARNLAAGGNNGEGEKA